MKHTSDWKRQKVESKRGKQYHANRNQKRTRVTILLSDKIWLKLLTKNSIYNDKMVNLSAKYNNNKCTHLTKETQTMWSKIERLEKTKSLRIIVEDVIPHF